MALVIPNIGSITNGTNGYDIQAVPDQTDTDAINAALAQTAYVIFGMQVTPDTGSDQFVSVAAGQYAINGVTYIYAGATGVAYINSSDGLDRRDIITVDTSGNINVTQGTDCGVAGWVRTNSLVLPPDKPPIPSNQVLLAECAVPYTFTNVTTINLVDKTVIVPRPQRRFVAVTQSATPAIDTDLMDIASITGLAQAITSMSTYLTGTAQAGDKLEIQLTDSGTGRAITWGGGFESSGTQTLPTTTVAGVLLTVTFEWNTVTSKWRMLGYS